jgi:hypothetical protein
LDHVQLSHGIQCDATYKLSWEGFLILIAGVSDQNRVFHPVCISLTAGETFQKYFHDEYLCKRSGWYEGIANRFPSSNNGLEATNRWIKDQGTLRSRLAMSSMIQFLLNQARSWSVERQTDHINSKIFATAPTVGLRIFTSAFHMQTHRWPCNEEQPLRNPCRGKNRPHWNEEKARATC